jgi:hypothetical protein
MQEWKITLLGVDRHPKYLKRLDNEHARMYKVEHQLTLLNLTSSDSNDEIKSVCFPTFHSAIFSSKTASITGQSYLYFPPIKDSQMMSTEKQKTMKSSQCYCTFTHTRVLLTFCSM